MRTLLIVLTLVLLQASTAAAEEPVFLPRVAAEPDQPNLLSMQVDQGENGEIFIEAVVDAPYYIHSLHPVWYGDLWGTISMEWRYSPFAWDEYVVVFHEAGNDLVLSGNCEPAGQTYTCTATIPGLNVLDIADPWKHEGAKSQVFELDSVLIRSWKYQQDITLQRPLGGAGDFTYIYRNLPPDW